MFFIYIILDTTPPIVTFSQPPPLTKAVAQLRWISNENAVFHCSLDNADFVDCGEGVSSLWVGTALRDGEHTLKVRATDDAGNIATPQRWTWRTGKEDPQHSEPSLSSSGRIRFDSEIFVGTCLILLMFAYPSLFLSLYIRPFCFI